MSDFDPDKYLAEKSVEFDPDAYLKDKVKSPSVSPFDATALGIGQGLTADFGDEIGGQIQGLLDRLAGDKGVSAINAKLAQPDQFGTVMTGDVGPTTSSELAKQATEENRALIKQAAEEQPMSYMAGSMIGSIPNAAILSAVAPSIFAGNGIAGLAKAGAAGGAISGLGGSEGGLVDNVVDTGLGALTGGVAGGTIGAVLSAASALPKLGSKAAKYIKEGIEDTSQMQTLKENYKYGKQGLKTYGKDAVENVQDMMSNQVPKELGKGIFDISRAVKSEFGKGVDAMGSVAVNPESIVKMAFDKVSELADNPYARSDIDALMSQIYRGFFENTEDGLKLLEAVPLERVQQFKQALGEMVKQKQLSGFGETISNSIKGEVSDIIANFNPEMSKLNKIYSNLGDALDNLKLGNISPKGYNKFFQVKNGEFVVSPKGIDQIQRVLIDSQKEGSKTALSAGTRLENATDILKDIASQLPKTPDIAKTIDKVTDQANYYNVVMRNAGKDTFTDMGKMQALLARTGNVAGFAKTALDNGFRSLSNATPQAIKDFANVIAAKGTPAAMKFAKQLVDIADRDNIGRNAALFALEQNPAYRDLFTSAGKK